MGMSHRGMPGGTAPRHLGGISQALGIAPSAPFMMGHDEGQQAVRGGHMGRSQINGQTEGQQRFQQAAANQIAALQQKANRGGPALAMQPLAGRSTQRGATPPVNPGMDRARSPAVGPYFAANGHSAAFAQQDPALSSAFPSLLNGLGRQGNARRDGSTHPLW